MLGLVAVGNNDGTNAKELIVERVVDHVHVVIGISLSAVDLARELAIRNRELVFPDLHQHNVIPSLSKRKNI